MATSIVPVSLSGTPHPKSNELLSLKISPFGRNPGNAVKMNQKNRKLNIIAKSSNGGRGVGVVEFVTGFILGGAVFGTLTYRYSKQLRRFLLDENEHGFKIARRPYYNGFYEEEDTTLERTRQILNEKISQLSSAIDNVSSRLRDTAIENVSSRLRGGKKTPQPPADPETEFTV